MKTSPICDIFPLGGRMKRKIYDTLLDWKENGTKPFMLLGARQVGKTYIIDQFCQNEFKNYVKVNLLEDKNIIELYETNKSSDDLFNELKVMLGMDLEEPDTILFIDEIQESESLISELKYFCEKHPKMKVIVAGSLLGVKLKRFSKSFPVGKVRMVTMYPMDFEEYLMALDQNLLIEKIKESYKEDKPLAAPIHEMALKFYRYYLITGGLPESVQNFIDVSCDLIKYNTSILSDILTSYFNDMKKYTTSGENLKIEKTYRSIPSQISNPANKFQFSKIEKNAKRRDYELPLDWLEASHLVQTSFCVSKPDIPLKGFADFSTFKLFISDVGILNFLLEIRAVDIIEDRLSLLKGAITENYVANALTCNEHTLFYWQSEGIAEIDFLLYTDDGIIPLEVKSNANTQSKSLNVYIEKYKPKYSIRVSSKNFGYDKVKKIKSVPLYAVFCIKK